MVPRVVYLVVITCIAAGVTTADDPLVDDTSGGERLLVEFPGQPAALCGSKFHPLPLGGGPSLRFALLQRAEDGRGARDTQFCTLAGDDANLRRLAEENHLVLRTDILTGGEPVVELGGVQCVLQPDASVPAALFDFRATRRTPWLPPFLCLHLDADWSPAPPLDKSAATPERGALVFSAVELRFGGYPGLACADGRYPTAHGSVHSTVVVLLVVDVHDRIRRTFGCFFQGEIQQLQAMAAEHGLRVISLQPASVSLAIPEADCVLPAAGLPSGLFDVQMNVLGADAAPAGCLMYGSSRPALETRAADNHTASGAVAADAPADGALLIRFQRVSFPVLECRLRAQTQPDVIVRGLVQPPDDHFTCRFRYRIKGQVLGALLRYLSAVYRLPLDTPPAGLPVLTLRPFTCGAGAGDDADVDFLVTGPRGNSAGCQFSTGDLKTAG